MDYQQPPSYIEATIDRVDVNKLKAEVFECMKTLEGWCAPEKAAILVDLVLKHKPDTIVEIGVFGGRSLIPMAYALRANKKGMIYGIDPWNSFESTQGVMEEINKHYWTIVDHEGILNGLMSKIEQLNLQPQIRLVRATSFDAPPIFNIDLLHIDGNHSDHTSYFDVTKWVPLVKKGGLIILDDMTWYENNKYTQARSIEWLNENCIKLAEFTDICVWGIWIKP